MIELYFKLPLPTFGQYQLISSPVSENNKSLAAFHQIKEISRGETTLNKTQNTLLDSGSACQQLSQYIRMQQQHDNTTAPVCCHPIPSASP